MSMTELEEICLNDEDKIVRRNILRTKARLKKLPKYRGKQKFSVWARCLLACANCGRLEPSVIVKNMKIWCCKGGCVHGRKGKMIFSLFKPKYRLF